MAMPIESCEFEYDVYGQHGATGDDGDVEPEDAETFDIDYGAVSGAEVCSSTEPVCEDIVTFARERLGFVAEPAQVEFLKSDAKRGLANCSRQCGKSTLAAIKALYRMWTRPGCLVLVAAPTADQSGEFLDKFRKLVRRGFGDWKLRGDGVHGLSIVFPNGSRIVGLPGEERTVRGFSSVSMLILDEAARVPDELYRALRPMLAVGDGDLWLLSTPFGRRGFFYEEWEFGGERWTRFRVPVTECAPRITAEFLAEELNAADPAWVRQEYLCEFLDSNGQWFDRGLVEEAVTEESTVFSFG